ncbi:MAG TPA: glycoside hydrolase family 16 protein [Solirubrobacteraceae bacterium]|nr:glycoside hydrolase family 16 protein [Solirubrobacteraceae bacterium]
MGTHQGARALLTRIAVASGLLVTLMIPASAVAAGGAPTAKSSAVSAHVAAAPTCGNEYLAPIPGNPPWTCTFDDEFNSTTGDANSLNTSWWTPQVTANSAYTTGSPGSEVCYVNSPNNISVSNGALHLTVRKESAPLNCGGLFTTQYTGGMVTTYSHFSQTYGRFEVRALLPQTAVQGLQETLWMAPVTDAYGAWPASGEVDFSEFYSEYPLLDVPYFHYNYNPATTSILTYENETTGYCPILPAVYNTYAVTWAPGAFLVQVNGLTCLIDYYVPDNGLYSPEPFNRPFMIALTQALGYGSDAFLPGTTPLPATTSVEYVRAWK